MNIKIMNTLEKIAEANDEFPSARLAAAIVKNNKIISIGINRRKTDPMQKRFGKTCDSIYLHAEVHAIKNALRHLTIEEIKNTTLYVCRVKNNSANLNNRKQVWGMAKPCVGCSRAISEFGIKNVIYTTDSHKEYAIV
jgi:tRNA(Arg) A34 adenosine deaminase TadA